MRAAVPGTRLAMLRMQVAIEQRMFWRNWSTVFFTFVLPLVLLVALGLSNDDPRDTVPVVAALGILSNGFQGLGIQLAMHRDQGVLKRVMATPMEPGLLILGKAVSIAAVVLLELVIIVAVGTTAFGAPFPEHPVALVAFCVLGTGAFVALGFAVASIIRTSDSAPAVTNAAYLALILSTVLFENLDGIPHWLAVAGDALPLSSLFVPVRAAWIGGSHWSPDLWWSALALVAWGALGASWSARRFRWEPAEER